MKNLKKGDKVIVIDQGLMSSYAVLKRLDPTAKPMNQGWVEEFYENDNTILVKFPIGNNDPEEHSQVAPYPSELVIRRDW